jgi:hypothetical protein
MYELLIIWSDGDREIWNYNSYETAEKAGMDMKQVFGNQIEWYGVKEAPYILA